MIPRVGPGPSRSSLEHEALDEPEVYAAAGIRIPPSGSWWPRPARAKEECRAWSRGRERR
jgi:hypothetical protein